MIIPHVKFRRRWVAALAVFCGFVAAEKDARATLGGDVSSVAANQEHLGGGRRIERLASGERHELTLPSGTVVRQYVSPSGAVYAISWHGPRMPDLRELLGSYFTQLARRDSRGEHHRMNLAGSDLVVQSTGHRHSFAGRAWVPSLLPAGVTGDASVE